MNNRTSQSGQMTHLDKITSRILGEAEEKAKETLEEADAEIARLRKEAESEKSAYAAEKAEKTRAALEAITERNASSAETEKRTVILREKERLLDEAYAKALAFLLRQPEEERCAFSLSLLKRALREIGKTRKDRALFGAENEFAADSSLLLYLNEKDRTAFGEKLVSSCKEDLSSLGLSMELSPETRPISGGFLLSFGDRDVNCDLEQLVAASRRKTEKDVYAVLFDA